MHLFLTVPVGSETCGPLLTSDSHSRFVAMQHPGEGGTLEARIRVARQVEPHPRWSRSGGAPRATRPSAADAQPPSMRWRPWRPTAAWRGEGPGRQGRVPRILT
jgi:secreted PhoX family phosphatase